MSGPVVFAPSVEDSPSRDDDAKVFEADLRMAARKIANDTRPVRDPERNVNAGVVDRLPAVDEQVPRLDDGQRERPEQAQNERRNRASSHACAQHPATNWNKDPA